MKLRLEFKRKESKGIILHCK